MSALIELGELTGHDEPRDRQQLSARMRRGLLAAGVAVACLLGTAGSARTEPGLEGPLWTGEVSLNGFGLGSGSVYLAEPNGKVVFARELTTGELRWRLDVDELPLFTVDVGGGVAAVVTRRVADRPERPEESSVTLVAEDTGEVLSRTIGEPHSTTAGPLLLTRQRPDCPMERLACMDVAAVDLATGADLWRISLPPDAFPVPWYDKEGRVESFAETRDGEIAIRDMATGAVDDRIAVPPGWRGQVTLLGDTLVTADSDRDEVAVTAYRRGPLTRAWSLAVPVNPTSGEFPGFFVMRDCGEVICLYADGNEVLIDAVTGQVRAKVDQTVSGPIGNLLLAQSARDERRSADRVVYLLDAAGHVVVTFPDVETVDWRNSGDRVLLAQRGPDRMAFTIVNREGRPRPLGSVTGANLSCQARDRALACSDPAGQLRVWRLPRPQG